MPYASYETVVGLEIHVQLATRSKVFCADDASFGGAPNTHVSAISLAHPGTLPRLNRQAVEYALRLGLALGCQINLRSTFDRKNYFYADLPKGYQITQDKLPICVGGEVRIGPARSIRIHHIHLEEDAGKSLHDQDPLDSLIDLNRAGVPLLEIVSEPDLRSADEVAAYMDAIRRLVRWLGVSDGNMEEGSLRCDVNVSVRKTGDPAFGQRCEIKNINSMRFARRAVEHETTRQIDILEAGGRIVQETRGYDAANGSTYSLREKEDAHDYRYFPEPDLPPVLVEPAELERIQQAMPPLPQALETEFQARYGLPANDAVQLCQDREPALYFREMAAAAGPGLSPRAIANLLIHRLLPWSAETGLGLRDCPVPPERWLAFLQLIESNQLSATTAYQRLFPALLDSPAADPAQLASHLNLLQNADAGFLETLADAVLARFPDKVKEYQAGKKGLLGLFMGELMKASQGKADPKAATQVLEEKLSNVKCKM
ncbi:MAG: Asp-tRNA(Asn)/Glu-tRNA(Gln) amidotransferase subunit GatB [Saprospiraceae bacterium]|nr:Asp-tRNA(Asn)/Glu-tRNA(Gln) amidotransferase subunit GatB [Saprospiraceae bacterium]